MRAQVPQHARRLADLVATIARLLARRQPHSAPTYTGWTNQQIVTEEYRILEVLKYELATPTPAAWIEVFEQRVSLWRETKSRIARTFCWYLPACSLTVRMLLHELKTQSSLGIGLVPLWRILDVSRNDWRPLEVTERRFGPLLVVRRSTSTLSFVHVAPVSPSLDECFNSPFPAFYSLIRIALTRFHLQRPVSFQKQAKKAWLVKGSALFLQGVLDLRGIMVGSCSLTKGAHVPIEHLHTIPLQELVSRTTPVRSWWKRQSDI